jgi:hypothetical protein
MQSDRSSKTLIRWSALLAGCGILIFVTAAGLVALLLRHLSLSGDYGSTFVVVHPAPLALSIVGSAVVLIAALFVRHIATHRLAFAVKRLSHIAIFGTAAGWLTIGAALFWLRAR